MLFIVDKQIFATFPLMNKWTLSYFFSLPSQANLLIWFFFSHISWKSVDKLRLKHLLNLDDQDCLKSMYILNIVQSCGTNDVMTRVKVILVTTCSALYLSLFWMTLEELTAYNLYILSPAIPGVRSGTYLSIIFQASRPCLELLEEPHTSYLTPSRSHLLDSHRFSLRQYFDTKRTPYLTPYLTHSEFTFALEKLILFSRLWFHSCPSQSLS